MSDGNAIADVGIPKFICANVNPLSLAVTLKSLNECLCAFPSCTDAASFLFVRFEPCNQIGRDRNEPPLFGLGHFGRERDIFTIQVQMLPAKI